MHNVGPDDPRFNSELLWGLGAGGPRQRPTDVDGASSWQTSSSEEARRFMGARGQSGAGKNNHGAITRAQLAEQGLIAVETPGEGPPAEAGLRHYSIRPADSPDPSVELTPQQMEDVKARLEQIRPELQSKPKEWGCG